MASSIVSNTMSSEMDTSFSSMSQTSNNHSSISSPESSTSSSPSPSSTSSSSAPITITTTVGSGPNKRKEVITLPLPPGTLPPRKRAKTKDEKEQRRIERIMRNRQAAHASREKKRRHVEELEKKCVCLTSENEALRHGFNSIMEQRSKLYDLLKSFAFTVQTAKNNNNISSLDVDSILAKAKDLNVSLEIPTFDPESISIDSFSFNSENSNNTTPNPSSNNTSNTAKSVVKTEQQQPTTTKKSSTTKTTTTSATPATTPITSPTKTTTTTTTTKEAPQSHVKMEPITSPSSPVLTTGQTNQIGNTLSSRKNSYTLDNEMVPSLTSSVASSPSSAPLDITNNSDIESDSVDLSHLRTIPGEFDIGFAEYRTHHSAEMMCS